MKDYALTSSDCSDVPTAFLKTAKDPKGNDLNTGEVKFPRVVGLVSEAPRINQKVIELTNKGEDYDNKVKLTTTR